MTKQKHPTTHDVERFMLGIEPDIRRLFSGIEPDTRRAFQRGSFLPRINPALREAMRRASQKRMEFSRRLFAARREQYERIYGKPGERRR